MWLRCTNRLDKAMPYDELKEPVEVGLELNNFGKPWYVPEKELNPCASQQRIREFGHFRGERSVLHRWLAILGGGLVKPGRLGSGFARYLYLRFLPCDSRQLCALDVFSTLLSFSLSSFKPSIKV